MIVYEINIIDEVIKSKLIIINLKECCFHALVSVQNFLNVLKSLGGSATMLIISRLLSTIKLC